GAAPRPAPPRVSAPLAVAGALGAAAGGLADLALCQGELARELAVLEAETAELRAELAELGLDSPFGPVLAEVETRVQSLRARQIRMKDLIRRLAAAPTSSPSSHLSVASEPSH
ncbi:MAG: hypothetical protein AB1726_17315, partial [Planctomycetota bacterium]